jgi:hypothetical protein
VEATVLDLVAVDAARIAFRGSSMPVLQLVPR